MEMIELGTWRGVPIPIRDDDRIFVTAIGKATGKRWNDYWTNQESREFAEGLASATGIPVSLLVESRRSGPYDQRGTWAHRRLALDFARWCDPPGLGVAMNGWCDELLRTGRVEVHREHSEAIVSRSTDDEIAENLCQISKGVQRMLGYAELILANQQGKRRNFGKTAIRAAVLTIRQPPFNKLCPMCGKHVIVDANGFVNCELHHHLNAGGNDPKYLLPLCTTCHEIVTKSPDLQHADPDYKQGQRRFQKHFPDAFSLIKKHFLR